MMEPLYYYPDIAFEAPAFPRGSSQVIPIDILPVEHIEPIEHLLGPTCSQCHSGGERPVR